MRLKIDNVVSSHCWPIAWLCSYCRHYDRMEGNASTRSPVIIAIGSISTLMDPKDARRNYLNAIVGTQNESSLAGSS